MSREKIKYWTCPCGRRHVVEAGKPIRCDDVGHQVFISHKYEAYRGKESKEEDKTIPQLGLF